MTVRIFSKHVDGKKASSLGNIHVKGDYTTDDLAEAKRQFEARQASKSVASRLEYVTHEILTAGSPPRVGADTIDAYVEALLAQQGSQAPAAVDPPVAAAKPGPKKPAPQLPPEANRTDKADAARAWAAVVAMCRSN